MSWAIVNQQSVIPCVARMKDFVDGLGTSTKGSEGIKSKLKHGFKSKQKESPTCLHIGLSVGNHNGNMKSRVKWELHERFRESLVVKVHLATRLRDRRHHRRLLLDYVWQAWHSSFGWKSCHRPDYIASGSTGTDTWGWEVSQPFLQRDV